MLSQAEEQDMHFARGGGGPVTENYLYEGEDEPALTEALHASDDHLPEDHEAEARRTAPFFHAELLMNHRDPMLAKQNAVPQRFARRNTVSTSS